MGEFQGELGPGTGATGNPGQSVAAAFAAQDRELPGFDRGAEGATASAASQPAGTEFRLRLASDNRRCVTRATIPLFGQH